jgi:hypothetical protein
MRNAYVYFSILLGLAIFLVVVFVLVFLKERLKIPWKNRLMRKPVSRESFYCIRTSLKHINQNFYVAQILFTNRRDCTLATQNETQRQSSEE